MDKFGDRLYILRKKKGISQDELANAVGSTKSTISKYERNIVDPTLESAQKIAAYFMVSLDWISGYGNTDDIMLSIPSKYKETIDEAISENISSDQLEEALKFIIKMRNKK